MVKHVTREDLRYLIRQRGEFRSAYISDTELNEYINVSLAHLYDITIDADPTYFLEYYDIQLLDGYRSYDLPEDFYKLLGVAIADVTALDGYRVLERFNFEERYDETTLTDDRDFRYEIRAQKIYIHPEPSETKSIRLEYIPVCPSLADDVSNWDSVNFWTEWVTLDVLIACAAKEETDPTIWIQQREKVEARIKGIGKRDLSTQKTSATVSTLRDLRRAIRNRGKWSREDISDNQLTEWVNDAQGALVDLISSVDPSYYLEEHYDVLSSGDEAYTLPSDFYKAVSVSCEYDHHERSNEDLLDGYYSLQQCTWAEYRDQTFVSITSDGDAEYNTTELRWTIRANSIYFSPTPSSPWSDGYSFRLDYIAEPDALSDPQDTISFPNRWIEWVILECAIKAAAAVGTDPQIFMAQQKRVEERIINFAKREIAEEVAPSNSITRADSIVKMVRARGGWSQEAITNNEIISMLGQGLLQLHNFIVNVEPKYFYTEEYLPVSSGDRYVQLPEDFFKLLGASAYDASLDADGYAVIDSFNFEERLDESVTSSAHNTRYSLQGLYLLLEPVPTWTGTIRVEYVRLPHLPDVHSWNSRDFKLLYNTFFFGVRRGGNNPGTATDQEYSDSHFWLEHLIANTAAKIAAKNKEDASQFVAQRQDVENNLKQFLLTRDLSQQKTSSTANNLKSLRSSIRSRGRWNREDITDAQLTQWINASMKAFTDLISRYDPSYYLTESDISVVSGTRQYSLPSDFYKVIGVAVSDETNPDGYAVMERCEWDERWDYNFSYFNDKAATRYYIRGDYIWFQPTPNWEDTVKLSYLPIQTELSAPSDTYKMQNGWEEWLINDVCCKICGYLKDGDRVQYFMGERAQVEERITRFSKRDKAKPMKITNVRRANKRWWW